MCWYFSDFSIFATLCLESNLIMYRDFRDFDFVTLFVQSNLIMYWVYSYLCVCDYMPTIKFNYVLIFLVISVFTTLCIESKLIMYREFRQNKWVPYQETYSKSNLILCIWCQTYTKSNLILCTHWDKTNEFHTKKSIQNQKWFLACSVKSYTKSNLILCIHLDKTNEFQTKKPTQNQIWFYVYGFKTYTNSYLILC